MHSFADLRCCAKIAFRCRSDVPSRGYFPDRPTLHNGQWLTRVKSELRIQRERAIVKRRLHKSHSREGALVYAINHSLHEHAAYGPILHVKHNCEGPDPRDCRTLVQTIAPD